MIQMISVASILQADEVWVTHGSGKNVQNIPVHAVKMSLGCDKALTLPMFHAPIGCDAMSFFNRRLFNLGKVDEDLSVPPKKKFTSIVHHRAPKSVNTTLIQYMSCSILK